MELSVVMQTHPQAYEEVLELLGAEGLNPVALSDPDSGAHYFPGSHAYAKTQPIVYIAVPRDEQVNAEQFLAKWQEALHKESKKITADARSDAFSALLVAGTVGIVLYALGRDIDKVLMSATVTWIVTFMIILSRSSTRSDPKEVACKDNDGSEI